MFVVLQLCRRRSGPQSLCCSLFVSIDITTLVLRNSEGWGKGYLAKLMRTLFIGTFAAFIGFLAPDTARTDPPAAHAIRTRCNFPARWPARLSLRSTDSTRSFPVTSASAWSLYAALNRHLARPNVIAPVPEDVRTWVQSECSFLPTIIEDTPRFGRFGVFPQADGTTLLLTSFIPRENGGVREVSIRAVRTGRAWKVLSISVQDSVLAGGTNPWIVHSPTAPVLDAAGTADAELQATLVQRVLDHPRVAAFLHTEIPAHRPLAVYAVNELSAGLTRVRVAGLPLQVVQTASAARIQFTAFHHLRARVSVEIAIPAEGVTGSIDLRSENGVWEYFTVDLHER